MLRFVATGAALDLAPGVRGVRRLRAVVVGLAHVGPMVPAVAGRLLSLVLSLPVSDDLLGIGVVLAGVDGQVRPTLGAVLVVPRPPMLRFVATGAALDLAPGVRGVRRLRAVVVGLAHVGPMVPAVAGRLLSLVLSLPVSDDLLGMGMSLHLCIMHLCTELA